MVTPAEVPSDGGEGLVGELSSEVHGDLTGPGNSGGAGGGEQLLGGELEVPAGSGLDSSSDRGLWAARG